MGMMVPLLVHGVGDVLLLQMAVCRTWLRVRITRRATNAMLPLWTECPTHTGIRGYCVCWCAVPSMNHDYAQPLQVEYGGIQKDNTTE